MAVPSPSDLSKQFATAYFDAAQAGADMRNVANVLETLRSQLSQSSDPYPVWATAFYDQIGAADLDRFMPALVKLADAFQSAVISAHVAQLRKVLEEDQERGWTEWLMAYAKSFDDAGSRGAYGAAIAREALSYSPHPDWSVERIRKAAQAVYDERWPETYDWFLFLAERDLPTEHRARFLAILAEIQIFHFLQLTKARTYLEKSSELMPDLLLTRNAWGEYWTAMGKWDEARKIFGEIIKAYPKRREGYIGMGDCDEKTGQLASAESWYYQAVLNAPGHATGYRSLVSLWLRPDQPKEKAEPAKLESQIQPILLRWKALVERPATVALSVGTSYKNAKQFDQARRYLGEAIQSDPSSAVSYVWLGYTELDEAAQTRNASPDADRSFASALDDFNQAVRLAPGALDGYWGISGLYMQQQNWPAAEEWTNRCLQLHPEWEGFVRVRRAEVLRQQGRLTEAEADLARSLELEGVNQAALDVMSYLVDDYRPKNQAAARRLLEQWKERSDPAQAYLYYNRLANWSYEAGDYASAVDLYRQALRIKEPDPVLHSNLAGALQKLRVPGKRCEELQEAIAELERANELAANQELSAKIAALRAERTFLEFYGEASAAAFDPVVDPIQVYIDWAVMPEILTGSNLAPDTTAVVSAIRARLKQQFGFVLPGVNFHDLQPPGSGVYRIVFNESTAYDEGAVKAGSVLSVVLGRLEQVVQDHMAEFVGHDAVARMLNELKSAPAEAIVQNVVRLTPLVGFLRWMLSRRQSIEPLAPIVEQFGQTTGTGTTSTAAAASGSGKASSASDQGFPRLAVKVGGSDPEFLNSLQQSSAELEKTLFNELGIPVPPIHYQHDAGLADRAAVLLLDGRKVSAMENMDAAALRASIKGCAPDLLVPGVTNCFLAKLSDRYPVLIRAVNAKFDVQAITSFLRRRLATGQSIKNLPGTLEDELWESMTSEWTSPANLSTLPIGAGFSEYPYTFPLNTAR